MTGGQDWCWEGHSKTPLPLSSQDQRVPFRDAADGETDSLQFMSIHLPQISSHPSAPTQCGYCCCSMNTENLPLRQPILAGLGHRDPQAFRSTAPSWPAWKRRISPPSDLLTTVLEAQVWIMCVLQEQPSCCSLRARCRDARSREAMGVMEMEPHKH